MHLRISRISVLEYASGLLILMFFIFVSLCFHLYYIPSDSMEDTFLIGDVVLIKTKQFRKTTERPSRANSVGCRGDIFVFKDVKELPGKFYIKRCVAYPGDTLLFFNNNVYINGFQQCSPKYSKFIYKASCENEEMLYAFANNYGIRLTKFHSGYFNILTSREVMNTMISQGLVTTAYLINQPNQLLSKRIERFPGLIIPKIGDQLNVFLRIEYGHFFTENEDGHDKVQNNYYFMLGDNRSNSIDSRSFGVIPESVIVGKAILILFSTDNHFSGLKKIRFDRILKAIN